VTRRSEPPTVQHATGARTEMRGIPGTGRRLTSGLPRLMGAAEIQRRLGVSRQRVTQLVDRDDFPAPYQHLSMGRVWWEADVDRWIRAYQAARSER
jgi:predicted DNA-binding transcriptional regulator AlpA